MFLLCHFLWCYGIFSVINIFMVFIWFCLINICVVCVSVCLFCLSYDYFCDVSFSSLWHRSDTWWRQTARTPSGDGLIRRYMQSAYLKCVPWSSVTHHSNMSSVPCGARQYRAVGDKKCRGILGIFGFRLHLAQTFRSKFRRGVCGRFWGPQ